MSFQKIFVTIVELIITKLFINLSSSFKMSRLEPYKEEIEKLCKTYNVKSLYAFGSVLTNNFNTKSDIDFLVNFAEVRLEDYADNYFDFKFSLQNIFKRPIDLLEEKSMRNPYLKQSVNKQRQLIYGK